MMVTADVTKAVFDAVAAKIGTEAAETMRCGVTMALALTAPQRQVLRTQIEAQRAAFLRAKEDLIFRRLRSAVQRARIGGTSVGKFAVGRDVGIANLNAKFDAAAAVLNRIPLQRVSQDCPVVGALLRVINRGAAAVGVKMDVGSLDDLRLARNGLEYELHKFTDLDTGLNMASTFVDKQIEHFERWISILDVLDTIEGT